jgi:hypothetical protein
MGFGLLIATVKASVYENLQTSATTYLCDTA